MATTTVSRTASAQPAPARSRHVDIDPPAPAPFASPVLSKPAAYEARANERVALRGQAEKIEAALAEAVASRDRAIARKAVDGSDAARAEADAATGAVVRIEADLAGVRSALARLEAQAEANAQAAAQNKAAAQIKAAAALAEEMLALAGEADAALAAYLTAHHALGEKLRELHTLAPARLHDALFGGGSGLGVALLTTAAKNQLAAGGIVPRQPFANPITASLSAAVAHFTKPLIEEAATAQVAAVDWD